MSRYTFELDIDAPRERVFALWVDLDRMTEWIEGVTRVTDLNGPSDRAGSRYTVWFGRFKSEAEVLEVDRPRYIRSRIRGGLLSTDNEARFDATSENATHLMQTFTTRGLMSAFWARIFATGSWKGSFRGELQTFKRLCEREARQDQR